MNYHSGRKRYIVDKQFQIRFIIRFSLMVFITALIISVIIYILLADSKSVLFVNGKGLEVFNRHFLLKSLGIGFIISFFFGSIAALLTGLVYSHRIAGPLYRFNKVFENMTLGNLKQSVALRRKDECQETARSLSLALESMRKKLREIDKNFRDLKNTIDSEDKKTVQKIQKLEDSISQFKY